MNLFSLSSPPSLPPSSSRVISAAMVNLHRIGRELGGGVQAIVRYSGRFLVDKEVAGTRLYVGIIMYEVRIERDFSRG